MGILISILAQVTSQYYYFFNQKKKITKIMNHYTIPHHLNPTTDSDSCSDEESCRGSNLPHSSTLINPSRKRRRGIIEKRRRDRINTSLSELKRLVPQALEKSGSAKLEKAEILQMTVDHLKTFN